MTTIRLTTWVNAPVERCFLLATSRNLSSPGHSDVPNHAFEGGFLEVGETIRWKIGWSMASYTSRIEAIRPYTYFRDVMMDGIFRHYEHDHHFAAMDDGTRVRDEIRFTTRLGPVGHLLESVLRNRLLNMLIDRNDELKRLAESDEWQRSVQSGDSNRQTMSLSEAPSTATNMQRFA
jgi:hypothetical protein